VRAAYEKAIGQKVEGATFFKVHGAGVEEKA
jgi:5,5'-dehydrodivanillate O-demethylase